MERMAQKHFLDFVLALSVTLEFIMLNLGCGGHTCDT